MKSLITRIITQSGIEPVLMMNGVSNTEAVFKDQPQARGFDTPLYTESDLYEIAEKVAKEWVAAGLNILESVQTMLSKANERAAVAEAENVNLREAVDRIQHRANCGYYSTKMKCTCHRSALSQPLSRTALDEAIAEATKGLMGEIEELKEQLKLQIVECQRLTRLLND